MNASRTWNLDTDGTRARIASSENLLRFQEAVLIWQREPTEERAVLAAKAHQELMVGLLQGYREELEREHTRLKGELASGTVRS